ncbi:MAG: hypothetical protein EON90_07525 [Brevundimonas sp.]|nr:MAG: hypothetical protein EON90_07525 [Brevundimonas sp.]
MALAYARAVQLLQEDETNEGGDTDVLDKLERIVLSHVPQSASEALEILAVLRSNIETGQRSDELDLQACDNLTEWLSTFQT